MLDLLPRDLEPAEDGPSTMRLNVHCRVLPGTHFVDPFSDIFQHSLANFVC